MPVTHVALLGSTKASTSAAWAHVVGTVNLNVSDAPTHITLLSLSTTRARAVDGLVPRLPTIVAKACF
jgi:hypothetical protein